jgi:hypothetical protein
MPFLRTAAAFLGLAFVALTSRGQDASSSEPPRPGAAQSVSQTAAQEDAPRSESKRIFFIVPNYRTSPSLNHYEPLTVHGKFKLAAQDAFDPGTIALAAMFAGSDLATNANSSFGHGVAGYSKYWAASYASYAIGDYMTEAIYPSFLHQDPRYFRRGKGSGWNRLGYAMGQIFWTHSDSGKGQFNYSEVLGNSTAVAISEAYYADNRNATSALSSLSVQLAVDATSNVLKEFWPEVERKLHRKHPSSPGE